MNTSQHNGRYVKRFSLRRFFLCSGATEPITSANEDDTPAQHIPTHAAASFLRTATPSIRRRNEYVAQPSIPQWNLSYFTIPRDSLSERADQDLDNTMPPTMTPFDFSKGALPSTAPGDQSQTRRAFSPNPLASSTSIAEQAEYLRARGSKRAYVVEHGLSKIQGCQFGNHSAMWSSVWKRKDQTFRRV